MSRFNCPSRGLRAIHEGRLIGKNPFGDSLFTERNWWVPDKLRAISERAALPPSQVALALVSSRPGIGSPIIGATIVEQLRDNLASRDISLATEHLQELNESSEPDAVFPYGIFTAAINRSIFGGTNVEGWR